MAAEDATDILRKSRHNCHKILDNAPVPSESPAFHEGSRDAAMIAKTGSGRQIDRLPRSAQCQDDFAAVGRQASQLDAPGIDKNERAKWVALQKEEFVAGKKPGSCKFAELTAFRKGKAGKKGARADPRGSFRGSETDREGFSADNRF